MNVADTRNQHAGGHEAAAEQQADTSTDGAGTSQNGAGEEEVVDAEVVDDEKTS